VSKTVVIGGEGEGSQAPKTTSKTVTKAGGLAGKKATGTTTSGTSGLGGKSSGGTPTLGGRSAGSTQITTVYVNTIYPLQYSPQAGQEIAEYQNSGTGTAFVLQRKFIYAEYVDEPVLMVNVSGETETKYYYHANNLYSVAALTTRAGAVSERYAYTAYGKPLFFDGSGNLLSPQPSGSALGNPYMYTGRRLDPETGLQYSRARYYDFDLGRFVGRDPIGYWAKDVNLYRYVGDKPLVSIDSSGLKKRNNTECCCDAKKAGLDMGDGGGVICCDGRKVPCSWQGFPGGGGGEGAPGGPQSGKEIGRDIVTGCIKVHERYHMPAVEECPQTGTTRPKPKDNIDIDKEEIAAHKLELSCLLSNMKNCKGDSQCEDLVRQMIRKCYDEVEKRGGSI
jgi:RHS repeat-associated protein